MTLTDDLDVVMRLHECRQTLRFLHGADYDRLIQPWRAILLAPPARPRATILAHALAIAQAEFHDGSETHAHATLWLMAAAVDLILAQPHDEGGVC